MLAIISGVRDMQAVLDKVWEHLLPAMQPDALPADPHAYGELSDKLAALSLPLPEGQPSSPKAEQWSGKTYTLEQNDLQLESVAIRFGDERGTESEALSASEEYDQQSERSHMPRRYAIMLQTLLQKTTGMNIPRTNTLPGVGRML